MIPQPEEREKSAIRNYAEKKIKQHGRKLTRKLAKKGAKVALKLIKAATMKFAALLFKLLTWLAGTIGLPVIGIGILILVSVIVISLAWSYLFGTGEGLEGPDKATYEYIVQQANRTVNMNSPLERPYRVPEKLIAATIQLEAFQKNDDIKQIIKKMANSLAPTFDYGKYDEWKEKQVSVYEDGKLIKNGEVQLTTNMVTKLDNVEYWNGSTTFKYTPKITPWETTEKITYREEKYTETIKEPYVETTQENYTASETKPFYKTILVPYIETKAIKTIDENGRSFLKRVTETKYREETQVEYKVEKTRTIEIKTITKTRQQYFEVSKSTSTDYATFDSVLNSYGLGINDKQLIELNYLFLGGTIAYTDWLKTMGGGDLGFISFDGNIIPGEGVPPQFMPYYRSAEKKYGVPWYVLAAIHFVETAFSTSPTMISSVGAIGPMQFMPATWVGWSYNIGGGLVSSSTDITSLSVIATGRGYGRDANGDGKADPWNVEDSIETAAYYLASNGYSSDPRNAIFNYNRAEWYVNKVLSTAEKFKNAATYEGGGDTPPLKPGSFMRPVVGNITSPFGYRSGGTHFGVDIGNGGKSVPVVASADGIVKRSYYSSSYGNVVFIQHNIGGQKYETVYAHMANRTVSQGSTVKQGQLLGYTGNTGISFGVHLHFEIHKNEWNSSKSNAINPALLIPF